MSLVLGNVSCEKLQNNTAVRDDVLGAVQRQLANETGLPQEQIRTSMECVPAGGGARRLGAGSTKVRVIAEFLVASASEAATVRQKLVAVAGALPAKVVSELSAVPGLQGVTVGTGSISAETPEISAAVTEAEFTQKRDEAISGTPAPTPSMPSASAAPTASPTSAPSAQSGATPGPTPSPTVLPTTNSSSSANGTTPDGNDGLLETGAALGRAPGVALALALVWVLSALPM